jgi:hypothetical protein
MKNRMSDLRNHLFETLEQLKDEEKPMDLQRAKAISEVAQTIINSAKVEVEFAKAISASTGSEFFGSAPDDIRQIGPGKQIRLRPALAATQLTRHGEDDERFGLNRTTGD